MESRGPVLDRGVPTNYFHPTQPSADQHNGGESADKHQARGSADQRQAGGSADQHQAGGSADKLILVSGPDFQR